MEIRTSPGEMPARRKSSSDISLDVLDADTLISVSNAVDPRRRA